MKAISHLVSKKRAIGGCIQVFKACFKDVVCQHIWSIFCEISIDANTLLSQHWFRRRHDPIFIQIYVTIWRHWTTAKILKIRKYIDEGYVGWCDMSIQKITAWSICCYIYANRTCTTVTWGPFTSRYLVSHQRTMWMLLQENRLNHVIHPIITDIVNGSNSIVRSTVPMHIKTVQLRLDYRIGVDQNGLRMADDIFDQTSLQYIHKGPNKKNHPALVQIMTRRGTGYKPLFKTTLALFTDANMRHSESGVHCELGYIGTAKDFLYYPVWSAVFTDNQVNCVNCVPQIKLRIDNHLCGYLPNRATATGLIY